MKRLNAMFVKGVSGNILFWYKLKNPIYVTELGEVYNHHGQKRKGVLSTAGYLKMKLIGEDGIRHEAAVHNLVMLAFVGPGDWRLANHKNQITTDNRLENLEYLTAGENTKYSWDNGRVADGGRKKPVTAYKDGELIGEFRSITHAAEVLGIKKRSISQHLYGKRKTVGGYIFMIVNNKKKK